METTFTKILKEHIGMPFPESRSPFGRWLNPVIASVEHGALELEFTIREEMTNPAGITHGGVISAMIDETIGVMMFCLNAPHFKPTINLVVDFLGSSRQDEVVRVKARVTKQGKNLYHAIAEMFRASDGRLIATGSSHMYAKA